METVYQSEAKPKICVPVMGANREELRKQAQIAAQEACDVIEWRMDYFDSVTCEQEVTDTAEEIKKTIGDKILLATFRTKNEGGEWMPEPEEYRKLLYCIGKCAFTDWVDVEYAMLKKMPEGILPDLKNYGKTVLLSCHDFQKTPSFEEMYATLENMEKAGGDIGKLAVMPEKEEDVLSLLEVTLKAKRELTIPVVTMSMSEMGKISRICGELSGSVLTFGCTEKASAPGQIPVEKLAFCLELLHLIPHHGEVHL